MDLVNGPSCRKEESIRKDSPIFYFPTKLGALQPNPTLVIFERNFIEKELLDRYVWSFILQLFTIGKLLHRRVKITQFGVKYAGQLIVIEKLGTFLNHGAFLDSTFQWVMKIFGFFEVFSN